MTPIRAGQIAAIALGQLLADGTGRGGRGVVLICPTPANYPEGLENYTRGVAIGSHPRNDVGAGVIQIDQYISGILIVGERLNINVTAFAIAAAQKAPGRWMEELGGVPQPLSRKSSSGLMMNQSNQVKVMKHGRQMAAHSLQSQKESVRHGLTFGIGRSRRTINSQRTVSRRLTDCLSFGVYRTI